MCWVSTAVTSELGQEPLNVNTLRSLQLTFPL